jgi:ribosome-associated toxin RatA of RatAB toxin-antitoxin module
MAAAETFLSVPSLDEFAAAISVGPVQSDLFDFRLGHFGRVCETFAKVSQRREVTTVEYFSRMHKTNSIIMHAPKMSIFETAANLELWPQILPHYRYIRYVERSPNRNVVVMAAVRSGIPIKWTSEQIIDRDRVEIHFHHLKAFSKGMRVVWTFDQGPDGVLVMIVHDLHFRIPALAPVFEPIIGDFFTHNVANKTLRCMRDYVEAKANRVAA